MTSRGGGDAGERDEAPRAYPLLVRLAGRWLCRHELAALPSREPPQERPSPNPG